MILQCSPEGAPAVHQLRTHLKVPRSLPVGKPCKSHPLPAGHMVTDASKIHPLIVPSPVASFSSLLLP